MLRLHYSITIISYIISWRGSKEINLIFPPFNVQVRRSITLIQMTGQVDTYTLSLLIGLEIFSSSLQNLVKFAKFLSIGHAGYVHKFIINNKMQEGPTATNFLQHFFVQKLHRLKKKLLCSALNMDSLVMFEMPAPSSMAGRLNLWE